MSGTLAQSFKTPMMEVEKPSASETDGRSHPPGCGLLGHSHMVWNQRGRWENGQDNSRGETHPPHSLVSVDTER